MLCQCSGIVVAALLELQELMRDIERGQHGDAIHALRARRVADFTHLRIEITRSGDKSRFFLRRAADEEFAFEDVDGDGLAHPLFSSARSRAIIASTRERACSFFASRFERSAESCSWLTRRLRFSSARR